MPDLNDVYLKFGFAAEAAQLLETELGNMLMLIRGVDEGLLAKPDTARASDILDSINRNTLGQLIKNLKSHTPLDSLDAVLSRAREERNRLFHSFYREHNFRRNSEADRAVMLKDLENIHSALLDAYKAVLALSGVDLDALVDMPLPTGHLPT